MMRGSEYDVRRTAETGETAAMEEERQFRSDSRVEKESDCAGTEYDPSKSEGQVNEILTNIISTLPAEGTVDETFGGSENGQSGAKACHRLIHENPMFLPRVEVHEVIKQVPKPEIEFIETVVEVPQVEFVDVYQTVERVEYVIKEEIRIEVVEVPVDVVTEVTKVEMQYVDNVIEVPAKEATIVPTPCIEETQFLVPRFSDVSVNIPVFCEIQPVIYETNDVFCVDVARYCPRLVPVQCYVPKFVQVPIKDLGVIKSEELEAPVLDVTLIQRLTVQMNPHLIAASKFNVARFHEFQAVRERSRVVAAQLGVATPAPTALPPVNAKGEELAYELPQGIETALGIDYFAGLPGFERQCAYRLDEGGFKANCEEGMVESSGNYVISDIVQSGSIRPETGVTEQGYRVEVTPQMGGTRYGFQGQCASSATACESNILTAFPSDSYGLGRATRLEESYGTVQYGRGGYETGGYGETRFTSNEYMRTCQQLDGAEQSASEQVGVSGDASQVVEPAVVAAKP